MSKIKFFLLLFFLVSSFFGCEVSSTNDDDVIKTELQGVWSKDYYSSPLPEYSTFNNKKVIVDGLSLTIIKSIYSKDETVVEEKSTRQYRLSIGDEVASSLDSKDVNAKLLDLQVVSHTITCETDLDCSYKNDNSVYGFTDWEIGVPKHVEGLSLYPKLETMTYNVFYIDENTLYIGEEHIVEEKHRPTFLDDFGYVKQ